MYVQCGPNSTIPVIIGVNFHQVRPILRYGSVQTLLSRPYGGLTLHVVYFYLFIEVRNIKSKDRNDILQSFG